MITTTDPAGGIYSLRDASRLRELFYRQGYLLLDLRELGTEKLADAAVKALRRRYREDRRIQDAWWYCRAVRKLAVLPEVLSLLECYFGQPVFPFQTLNFRYGTGQPAHSDTLHFQTSPPGRMCGLWVALEDIDEANGPLFYFPGSHELPQYTYKELNIEQGRDAYRLYEQRIRGMAAARGFPRREAHLKKGQAVLWHANLLHGGSPVRDSDRTRHSQATHYFCEGLSYFTPRAPAPPEGGLRRRDVVDIRTGRRVSQYENGKPVAFRPVLLKAAKRERNKYRYRDYHLFRNRLSRLFSSSRKPERPK